MGNRARLFSEIILKFRRGSGFDGRVGGGREPVSTFIREIEFTIPLREAYKHSLVLGNLENNDFGMLPLQRLRDAKMISRLLSRFQPFFMLRIHYVCLNSVMWT